MHFNAESSMPRKNSVVEWAGKPQRHFDAMARKKNAPRNGGMAACKATLRCCDEESTSADGVLERRHLGGWGIAIKRLAFWGRLVTGARAVVVYRSEEHTSELQSRQYLVCRL